MQQQKTKLKARTIFIYKKLETSGSSKNAQTEPTLTTLTFTQTHNGDNG